MRSLRIILHVQQTVTLPLAYNELIQGLLYSCWHREWAEVHDLVAEDGKPFRPFVFGRLEGKARVNGRDRTISFRDVIRFEVRSPVEELIGACARELAHRDKIRLGTHELELINLQSYDRLLFPKRAFIAFRSPALSYRTLDDGHTRFFSPEESDWIDLVRHNAVRKAEIFGVETNTGIQVIPLTETLQKHVTRFKGTYLTGWTGRAILAGEPELLALLWCCGLGSRNSQGFGFFDILDKPVR